MLTSATAGLVRPLLGRLRTCSSTNIAESSRVLEATRNQLGQYHPKTIAAQFDVARALHEAGRRAESLELARNAAALKKELCYQGSLPSTAI